ncbi:MAG: hypothetical protein AB7O26_14165, partial [Planctomycetaceae bacterium]
MQYQPRASAVALRVVNTDGVVVFIFGLIDPAIQHSIRHQLVATTLLCETDQIARAGDIESRLLAADRDDLNLREGFLSQGADGRCSAADQSPVSRFRFHRSRTAAFRLAQRPPGPGWRGTYWKV